MSSHTKSPKEQLLDKKLLQMVDLNHPSGQLAQLLIADDEIEQMQDYANSVSILRLGYNDHGPVHMRKVAINAITMMTLLKEASIPVSLEQERTGSFDDSLCAVLLASFLHDVGMGIGREGHELLSVTLAFDTIKRVLAKVFPTDIRRQVIIRSLALEGIVGHMANRTVHSLEAGIILLADGCDMEKGRARIPIALSTEPKMGDIHKYSANSIESVSITRGEERPIRIEVEMSSDVGFFQVEEVLFPKVNSSTVKPYIELLAGLIGKDKKQYV